MLRLIAIVPMMILVFAGEYFAGPAWGGELVLKKEPLFDRGLNQSGGSCEGWFTVPDGKDVPDLRDFQYYFCEGFYSFHLDGSAGTEVTLFGEFFFGKGQGFLSLKKMDDRRVWILDLEKFPPNRWTSVETSPDTGAYEVYYHPAPAFEKNISSIKWGAFSG